MRKMVIAKCPDCNFIRLVRLSNYKRSNETGLCLSCANLRMGRGNSGHKHEGYVFIKQTGHPRATREGFVKRAVLVFEGVIGRKLSRQEHLHHINGVRDDDRPENLVIMTNSEHARLHRKQSPNLPVLKQA